MSDSCDKCDSPQSLRDLGSRFPRRKSGIFNHNSSQGLQHECRACNRRLAFGWSAKASWNQDHGAAWIVERTGRFERKPCLSWSWRFEAVESEPDKCQEGSL